MKPKHRKPTTHETLAAQIRAECFTGPPFGGSNYSTRLHDLEKRMRDLESLIAFLPAMQSKHHQ